MPPGYYAICARNGCAQDVHDLSPDGPRRDRPVRRRLPHAFPPGRLDRYAAGGPLPQPRRGTTRPKSLKDLLEENGFDPELHEQIRADLRAGRIGLAQNRLPASVTIEDVAPGRRDRQPLPWTADADGRRCGERALAAGEVAVLALAARGGKPLDAGGRRGQGPAPLLPFPGPLPQLHRGPPGQEPAARRAPVRRRRALYHLHQLSDPRADPTFPREQENYGYPGPLMLSPGRSVGLRMIPMARDLRFAWEEMPQQVLDVQAQKVRESLHASLIAWAEAAGGGSDYTDNLPLQCLHPTGHWFEVPNLLRNGVLARLLAERPQLKYLMLHNIDTLGADLDRGHPGRCTSARQTCLSFEVIRRRIEDRGGGLARVDGRVRLVEGLAMPREEDEFRLTYYNSMTTWITIDRLLEVFGLSRDDLADEPKVTAAIRRLERAAAHLHHAQGREEAVGPRARRTSSPWPSSRSSGAT